MGSKTIGEGVFAKSSCVETIFDKYGCSLLATMLFCYVSAALRENDAKFAR